MNNDSLNKVLVASLQPHIIYTTSILIEVEAFFKNGCPLLTEGGYHLANAIVDVNL